MRSILTTVLILAFGGPLFASDPPAAPVGKAGPFEGGSVMNAADKTNCKLAIRLAARLQRIKGKISRSELQTVLNATDNREAMEVVNSHVQDMVLEQAFSGQKAGPRAAGGWLQWILDNFPQILQMVMQIIGLFSQDLPPDGMLFCTLDTQDMQLCGWGRGCAGGQCTTLATAIEAPVLMPMPDQPRTVLKTPVLIQHEPLRNAAKATVFESRRVLRGIGRRVAAPFRWLRGCP